MTTNHRRPRVLRAVERALLTRDRIELAAAARLLTLLKLEKPPGRARARRPRRQRTR